ncbi:hypothetical protein M404DRAFT_996118 [Pisolithus tinctorius Marx 270]|uniref:Uncharacterized protein n=1 Tax=Pisolithus tinctorius Marx 270 TaxID=870435 RepID=A0A0C3P9F3_PISTI|nr:hypothetical protein M404DRAFT_996118 [Pisolithus tinctorius Marx 270]
MRVPAFAQPRQVRPRPTRKSREIILLSERSDNYEGRCKQEPRKDGRKQSEGRKEESQASHAVNTKL